MKPPISVLMSSNERGSERAKALALAIGGDPAYELQGFAELPVDMALQITQECPQCHGKEYPDVEYNGDEEDLRGTMLKQVCGTCGNKWQITKTVHVELKEIPDFWSSKASGHLGTQVLQMVAAGSPAFVAVFGSLQEVMEQVPQVSMDERSRPRHRSENDKTTDLNTARAFAADAASCGVPVHFLSSDHETSFRYILSYAKHILTGPNMASFLPRFPVDPAGYGMLCSIRGIGHEAALALLQAYGGVEQIVDAVRIDIDALADTPVNGKRLGAAKAGLIARAVGV